MKKLLLSLATTGFVLGALATTAQAACVPNRVVALVRPQVYVAPIYRAPLYQPPLYQAAAYPVAYGQPVYPAPVVVTGAGVAYTHHVAWERWHRWHDEVIHRAVW